MSSQQEAAGRFCDNLQLTELGIWGLPLSPRKQHSDPKAFVTVTDHQPGVLLTLLDLFRRP